MDEEGLQETDKKLIHIGKPLDMDDDWFREQLEKLDEASRHESDRMKLIVSQIVPTYRYDPSKKKEKEAVHL